MGAKREPNTLLAAVMQRAGVNNKGLTIRVRAEGVKIGHGISPDHVSVRRWLDGMRRLTSTFFGLYEAATAILEW